jgi:hypothetical protein
MSQFGEIFGSQWSGTGNIKGIMFRDSRALAVDKAAERGNDVQA